MLLLSKRDRTVKKLLKIPERETVWCGMALGYGDDSAPVNKLVSEREPIEKWVTFASKL